MIDMNEIKWYPHQIEALNQTEGMNRVAYYLDMGLGKTFIGAEKAVRMNNKVILVVCQKSKVNDWIDHFKTYYDRKVFNLTIPKEFSEFHGLSMGERMNTVGVINYDLIWRRKTLADLDNFTLLLDESSLIQNVKSKRTKFILKLSPYNVILLSGTPTGGKYENLWSQLHLLGWDIKEKVYEAHYVNWKNIQIGGFIHKIVDKNEPYKNVDRLKRKMREHGAVFMKTEEVFDLPSQNIIEIKVPTTKEYKTFKKDSLVTVDGIEFVGDSILSYRLYQRVLCTAYNPNKIQAFRELLESTQDRLIVFYNFNSELIELQAVCNDLDRPYSMVNGSVKDLTAYEEESNSVTLVQSKAGAMGLNLQKANKIVYFGLTEEAELFQQSMKRIHRIGQERPCFYYLLICENSIEDLEILPTLNIRKEYTDELFQENNNLVSSDNFRI